MTKIIYLHKDELNAIALCVDGHKGIQVQLIAFRDTLIPNSEGMLESSPQAHIEMLWTITTRSGAVLNKNFKQELASAVSQAQQRLVEIQQNYELINGALKDYGTTA